MKRLVVSAGVRENPGFHKSRFVGGSWLLTLECGHFTARKLSAGRPGWVQCRDCKNLKNGGTMTCPMPGSSDPTQRVRETWDATKQWPKREVITSEDN